ncbi:unnamed protein product [Closterium sp. NIES-53]
MAPGQHASAEGMAVEGVEDEGEADLAATTSMEAAGVADTTATTRATDTVAADSMASATMVTRADICGAIASSSLIDGPLLKAKRVEEQEEGEEESIEDVVVAEVVLQRAEVKGMGKAMFKGDDGKMVGLKHMLGVPNIAANLISVRRLQKAGMDTSSKGANLHREASGSKHQHQGKLGEHEESGLAAKEEHKGEENPKAAAEEEYGESMWGTIASAAFSNPTSATGECDWLTLHRRMGHVALPILQQLVKDEMVAGIRVKGEPDEVLGCPTCMQAKFTRYPFSSSEATAKAPLDEVEKGRCRSRSGDSRLATPATPMPSPHCCTRSREMEEKEGGRGGGLVLQVPSLSHHKVQQGEREREEEAWRQLLLLRHIRHPLTPSPRHPHGGGGRGGRGAGAELRVRL